MSDARTILIVAAEGAFRRSMEFALEVEGFIIEPYALLASAAQSPSAAKAICVVIDDGVLEMETDVPETLNRITKPIIYLADGFSLPQARKE